MRINLQPQSSIARVLVVTSYTWPYFFFLLPSFLSFTRYQPLLERRTKLTDKYMQSIGYRQLPSAHPLGCEGRVHTLYDADFFQTSLRIPNFRRSGLQYTRKVVIFNLGSATATVMLETMFSPSCFLKGRGYGKFDLFFACYGVFVCRTGVQQCTTLHAAIGQVTLRGYHTHSPWPCLTCSSDLHCQLDELAST